jgi:hypothetical protein
MKAKQHTPVKPMQKRAPEYTQETGTHQGRTCHPSKGESPKSKMVDGPFGGKKPA